MIYRWLCLFLFCFSACEKGITFNLDKTNIQLVVDGSIENGKAPVIILSRSLDYFSSISPAILESSFIHGAEIHLSNGIATQQLKEYSVPLGQGDSIYYYTIDSSNLSQAFSGVLNTHYSLQILSSGQQYSAETTIPALAKKIDSLWWKPAPDNPDTSKVILMSKVTDPAGLGNYIRYFTKVDDSLFYPGLNSVFDDQIVDGSTYSIPVEKGVDRNRKIDFENYSFFNRGDTVTVKLCNIDKATYDFWRTMEFSYQSIGNPFSSPTKVLGNISSGALGYFGGYAAQYKTLIIPK
jgi:hypothetical protein